LDAFDADVLIYAAAPRHPLGHRVRALLAKESATASGPPAGIGSLLLIPEVLGKPLRDGAAAEVRVLAGLLARLDLRPLDRATAEIAATLAGSRGLRAADAVHLATALSAGADRFITNNHRDFPDTITEIEITYPDQLPDPAEGSIT
jgi:predicted nucleic acid-binding protein